MNAPEWLIRVLEAHQDACYDTEGCFCDTSPPHWSLQPGSPAPEVQLCTPEHVAEEVWTVLQDRLRPLISNPYFAQVTTGEVKKTDATRLVFVDELLEALT